MSGHDAHSTPATCENCGIPLQGQYCYACGQSLHSPTRHFAHALEEVFESFWHLDGRIFRSLRDLLVPGRIALNYLAGQRVRYVAPLRLFVVLSVLTFFVAQFTLHLNVGGPTARVNVGDVSVATRVAGKFTKATTVAEVVAMRDADLKAMREARAQTGVIPGVGQSLDKAIALTEAQAQLRIKQLQPASTTADKAEVDTKAAPLAAPDSDADEQQFQTDLAVDGRKPWDEQTNPVKVGGLPGFANAWLNHQVARGKENLARMKKDPELYTHALISSVPSALIILVPVFALFLKLGYLGSGRLYLEHLVVALYSHAFLCLALLALFVMVGLDNWITPHAPWFGTLSGWGEGLLWAWMPLYLLFMQKRVYGNEWPLTLLRYCVIGTMYLVLVTFAVALLAIASVVRM
ncbi:MAG TPA: DUF3667 domain-containing protein [Lysobacter sp.]|jgi:hypothetical protein|nr:DUF3667 domain-containing protein [Lysobacter sp.]